MQGTFLTYFFQNVFKGAYSKSEIKIDFFQNKKNYKKIIYFLYEWWNPPPHTQTQGANN